MRWPHVLRSHGLDNDIMDRAVAATVARDHGSDLSLLKLRDLKRIGAASLVNSQATQSDATFNSGGQTAKALKRSKNLMGNPLHHV